MGKVENDMPITQSETVRVLMQVLDRFDSKIDDALKLRTDDIVGKAKWKALEFARRAMLDTVREIMQVEAQCTNETDIEVVVNQRALLKGTI